MTHVLPLIGCLVGCLVGCLIGGSAGWFAASAPSPRSSAPPSASRIGALALDTHTPYFHLESKVSVGNKGEEILDVSVDARCGRAAWLFHHAELVVERNRFGDVQFVALPSPGCVECAPVEIRWFHEPTGYLSFEVNVYRRLEVVPCRNEDIGQQRHRPLRERDRPLAE